MILFEGAMAKPLRRSIPQPLRRSIAWVNALEWVIELSVYAGIWVDDRLWLAGDRDGNRQ